MIAQLRATRAGAAVVRNILARQRTPFPCSLSPGNGDFPLHQPIRFASDYRSSARGNTFGIRQRDRGDGDERKFYDRRPSTFGSQKRGDGDAEYQDRPRRRNEDEVHERPPYRPRSFQGEPRGFVKTDRSVGTPRQEYRSPGRAFKGQDTPRDRSDQDRTEYKRPERAFNSERRDAPRESPRTRSNILEGYVKRDRPTFDKFRRNSKESGEGGMSSRSIYTQRRFDVF